MSDKTDIQKFFDMDRERKVPLEMNAWVPLKVYKPVKNNKGYGSLGYTEDLLFLDSILVPADDKEKAFKLKWSDFGSESESGSYVDSDGIYCSAEKMSLGFNDTEGISPVLDQSFNGKGRSCWHLNQDIVIALNLFKKGNSWLASNEGFEEVAVIELNHDEEPCLLKIRTDYLKDYLCARGMGLYINTYRSRIFVVGEEDKDTLNAEDQFQEKEDHYEWRTYKNRSKQEGKPAIEFWSELWKSDWVSPGDKSHYIESYYTVRDARNELSFIKNVSGENLPQNKLTSEFIFLWFKPECVLELLGNKGGHLKWIGTHMGVVGCGLEGEARFGVHDDGYLNVYAKDIGLLPYWQQKIWHAHNITPGDGLAEELYKTQVQGQWLDLANAPEDLMIDAHNQLEDVFNLLYKASVFSKNINSAKNLENIHRFRSISYEGLGDLAVDLYEKCIKFINRDAMIKIMKNNNLEVMKDVKASHPLAIFQMFLIHHGMTNEKAADILKPLLAIRELRNNRVHRNNKDLSNELSMVNIRKNVHAVHKGYDLLNSYVKALNDIRILFERSLKDDV